MPGQTVTDVTAARRHLPCRLRGVRDGPIRSLVKWLARSVKAFDLSVTRALQVRDGEQRYRLSGSCTSCGKCCETPTIPVGKSVWFMPTLRRLFLWWQRVVNGFELIDTDPRFKLFIFKCTHFDPVTKQCDSYESRPLMCRDYPYNLTFQAVPSLFPECSYVVHDKKAEALREALVKAGVEGEKLAELEKKLFLTKEKE